MGCRSFLFPMAEWEVLRSSGCGLQGLKGYVGSSRNWGRFGVLL